MELLATPAPTVRRLNLPPLAACAQDFDWLRAHLRRCLEQRAHLVPRLALQLKDAAGCKARSCWQQGGERRTQAATRQQWRRDGTAPMCGRVSLLGSTQRSPYQLLCCCRGVLADFVHQLICFFHKRRGEGA